MTDSKKEIKIEFAPGCFDDFEGTQEELDDMIAEITRMAQTGELFENAMPLDDALDEYEDEVGIVIDKIIENQNKRLH